MLQIHKQAEPQEVINFKALPQDNWQPSYKGLTAEAKTTLRKALVTEQGGVCCYCNRHIGGPANAIEDGEFHIEHFRPQHAFTHLELDYQNLHASCFKNDSVKGRRHCGPAKDKWFDTALTLSPLNNNSGIIRYGQNGTIFSNSSPAAAETIKRLALDHAMLIAEREAEIAGKLDADFIQNATNDDLVKLYRAHQQMQNGRFQPFAMAVMQCIAALLPAPLRATL